MRKVATVENSVSKIFVLGRHRSGTTWVTNILAAHPSVFTPEHQAHQGQHESAFFSSLVPYCRFGKTEVDLRAISAIFERSDYWKLLFPHTGPEIDIADCGLSAYFSQAMDQAAKDRKCAFWVEKTPAHTLVLRYLLKEYPDAYFVRVRRHRADVIRSNVYKFGNPGSYMDWIRHSVWHELYEKVLDLYDDQIYSIEYEALVDNPDRETHSLFHYLGIPPENNLASGWAADSSFGSKPPEVEKKYLNIIHFNAFLFRFAPRKLCERFVSRWLKKRGGFLPPWFFKVYKGMDADHERANISDTRQPPATDKII